MKKILSILFLFILSISAFAATRTGFYQSGQTKASVLQSVKAFEKDILTYNYKMLPERKISASDYTQIWSYVNAGSTSEATMRYQFYDDKVLVTMTNAAFISKNGTRIPLQENDPSEVKRKVYESLENVMITVYFKYLQVSETKSASIIPIKTTSETYDSITKNYAPSITKKQAIQNFQNYNTAVLSIQYNITYLNDKNADIQDVKFEFDAPTYSAAIIVHYEFRGKDFSIQIKSFDHYNKTSKATTVINKNIESHKTFYNMTKEYLLDKHSKYISGDSL